MKKKNFINNKGIAMITIMITISFLAIIATTLLYISATNYSMKVANSMGKDNYYETDGILVKTTSSIRNSAMKQSNPINAVKTFKTDPTDDACDTYSVVKVAQLVYPGATGGDTSASITIPGAITGDSDTIKFKSTNNKIEIETGVTAGVTTYTFKDIEIVQTSARGYSNSVKTDLRFDIFEKVTPGGSAGGVGNMSMMLDNPLQSSAAEFKCLTMTGNAFMANYVGTGTLDGENYIGGGAGDDGGLVMSNESRLNLKGGNNVIYGDLYLKGNSSLAVYGNLTVYGDIKVEDNATLILSEGGHLYQLKSDPLPGRLVPSKFEVSAGNVYPAGLVPEEVSKDNFKDFAKTIGINTTVNTTGEYGLVKKILKPVSSLGGKRVIDLDCSVDCGTTYSSSLTKNDQGASGKHSFELNSPIYTNKQFGCGFLGNSVDSALNGGYEHLLMISLEADPIVMQQSNPYTTWIANSPVTATQAHCITLSKVGTDEFNYMTAAKGDPESAAYNTTSNPFNNISFKFGGTTYTGKFGDFFEQQCNVYVDQMFGYSVPGGGASTTTYASAVNFENYSRDFE